LCGKNLIKYYNKQQEKISKSENKEPTKIIAPPKIKNLLKEGEEEKWQFKKKLDSNIYRKYNDLNYILELVALNGFLSYSMDYKLINKNVGLFINYVFYDPKHNLLLYLEFYFKPGKEGELSSYLLTDKDTVIENKTNNF